MSVPPSLALVCGVCAHEALSPDAPTLEKGLGDEVKKSRGWGASFCRAFGL
jgi:hypothetical protein